MISQYLASYPDQALLGLGLLLYTAWSDPQNNLLKTKVLVALFICAAMIVAHRAGDQASLVYALFLIVHAGLLQRCLISSHRPVEIRLYSLAWAMAAHLMIEARDWLQLFIGGELLSVPFYAWLSLRKNHQALSIGARYFLQSALFSALFLMGLSLCYGNFSGLGFAPWPSGLWADVFWVLVFAWFFFKLGVAPIGFWVTDVYELLAPQEIVWMSVVPKYAFLGGLAQVAHYCWSAESWFAPQKILLCSIALTVVWGHSAAWAQKRWAQFFAYSAIAQSGMALAPLLIGSSGLVWSLLLQGLYGLSLTLFFMSKDDKSLCYRLGLLSLSGLPPTPLFVAKVSVFIMLIQSGYELLTALLMLSSVLSLAYYLRLYTHPLEEAPAPLS